MSSGARCSPLGSFSKGGAHQGALQHQGDPGCPESQLEAPVPDAFGKESGSGRAAVGWKDVKDPLIRFDLWISFKDLLEVLLAFDSG